jgi:hypothetical protein
MKYGKFGFNQHCRQRLFYQPGAEQKFNLGQIAYPFSLEWVLATAYITRRWVKNDLRNMTRRIHANFSYVGEADPVHTRGTILQAADRRLGAPQGNGCPGRAGAKTACARSPAGQRVIRRHYVSSGFDSTQIAACVRLATLIFRSTLLR